MLWPRLLFFLGLISLPACHAAVAARCQTSKREFLCTDVTNTVHGIPIHYRLSVQIPLKDCSVYDPAFTSGESNVLRELGMTVITENEVSCWPLMFFFLSRQTREAQPVDNAVLKQSVDVLKVSAQLMPMK